MPYNRLMTEASTAGVDLTRHFLIAMPNMTDPHFAKSLTLVCEHNDQGALGVVINRPIDLDLHTLLEQISIKPSDDRFKAVPVHFGGPVQVDRGFVLHAPVGGWQSTMTVGDTMGLTTSKDILEAVARGDGPERMLITLGYAGWGPGQLESEIAQNAWLTVPASDKVIFDMAAEDRLTAAMKLLGVNYANLSDVAGHA